MKKVVLVSIPKAGTHLVSRLVEALGYTTRFRLDHEVSASSSRTRWQRDLLELKAGECLVVHRLTPVHLPRRFLREWQESDTIRILYHARDPRDVLLSGLHALGGSGEARHHAATFLLLAELLACQEDQHRRIDFLLRDIPRSWTGALDPLALFRELDWLRLHPRVCSTRFEELVGPRGGGDAAVQRRAIVRVCEHLGSEVAPDTLLDQLWSGESRTFRRGQIGDWRDAFDAAQTHRFTERYGDLLAAYAHSTLDTSTSLPGGL